MKNPAADAGDMVLTTGQDDGSPLQDSCLGSPLDRGAWWAMGCKELGHNSAQTHTRWDSEERN